MSKTPPGGDHETADAPEPEHYPPGQLPDPSESEFLRRVQQDGIVDEADLDFASQIQARTERKKQWATGRLDQKDRSFSATETQAIVSWPLADFARKGLKHSQTQRKKGALRRYTPFTRLLEAAYVYVMCERQKPVLRNILPVLRRFDAKHILVSQLVKNDLDDRQRVVRWRNGQKIKTTSYGHISAWLARQKKLEPLR